MARRPCLARRSASRSVNAPVVSMFRPHSTVCDNGHAIECCAYVRPYPVVCSSACCLTLSFVCCTMGGCDTCVNGGQARTPGPVVDAEEPVIMVGKTARASLVKRGRGKKKSTFARPALTSCSPRSVSCSLGRTYMSRPMRLSCLSTPARAST